MGDKKVLRTSYWTCWHVGVLWKYEVLNQNFLVVQRVMHATRRATRRLTRSCSVLALGTMRLMFVDHTLFVRNLRHLRWVAAGKLKCWPGLVSECHRVPWAPKQLRKRNLWNIYPWKGILYSTIGLLITVAIGYSEIAIARLSARVKTRAYDYRGSKKRCFRVGVVVRGPNLPVEWSPLCTGARQHRNRIEKMLPKSMIASTQCGLASLGQESKIESTLDAHIDIHKWIFNNIY